MYDKKGGSKRIPAYYRCSVLYCTVHLQVPNAEVNTEAISVVAACCIEGCYQCHSADAFSLSSFILSCLPTYLSRRVRLREPEIQGSESPSAQSDHRTISRQLRDTETESMFLCMERIVSQEKVWS